MSMRKMRILATGNVEEFDDSYARRLYEFGKAVFVAEDDGEAKAETQEKAVAAQGDSPSVLRTEGTVPAVPPEGVTEEAGADAEAEAEAEAEVEAKAEAKKAGAQKGAKGRKNK